MVDNRYFTCIGKGHGAPAIPATRKEWEELRNAPWLAEMCRRIAAGDESLKAKLPVWTPGCAEFKNNHRALKDAVKPLRRLMLDFDEKGHSAEILAKAMELQAAGKWKILLVEESVRRGTHVLIALPEEMTPQEAQQRFSTDVGFVADPALKDVASRCIYMVPSGNTLYMSEEFFEAESSESSENSEGSENSENSENSKSSKNSKNSEYPETYDGIPYTEIVATLEEQMGGRPEHGSRNNFIFSMACHLRYVTNDDPEWIAQVLPTYGEARDKWMATIRSACARSQTKTMPRIMRRTLAICKERLEDNSEFRIQNTELAPPPMPRRLPPLIKLLVSRTPRVYRAAVAHAVFPALGAHLWKTRFRYIDNVLHEATLMNVLVGETGAGKNCISEPINHILRDIRQRDMENLSREREWKREMVTKGANKDKRQRPEGLVIQEIDPDMTNAAFVQRLADAEERFLYTKMNEIDQFDALKTSARSKAHFQIMCLSFDPDNVYGQTRVGTSSVSERVCIRFNWNAATTIRKGQAYFQGVLTDGPISRINFCMIPPREIGSEMPVYGSYDAAFDEELRPYIECLTKARGTIECRQAMTLAKRLVEECAETARLSQNRVYENLSFRANVIAYLKAMVLYVAHGERWDKTMEEFVRWSLHYDLWCKMHLFGEAIEAQEATGENKKHRGPQNLLDLLPEVFTREEAGALRTRMGVRGGSLTHMLNNWKQRGYIELYGEEMTRDEAGRQRYIKTEEYLRRHGGKLKIES
ncbi:MAG: VirE protein [Bacteroidaceae bacterium]|nr:VirE protein [Bacteroidaceae bacterium]